MVWKVTKNELSYILLLPKGHLGSRDAFVWIPLVCPPLFPSSPPVLPSSSEWFPWRIGAHTDTPSCSPSSPVSSCKWGQWSQGTNCMGGRFIWKGERLLGHLLTSIFECAVQISCISHWCIYCAFCGGTIIASNLKKQKSMYKLPYDSYSYRLITVWLVTSDQWLTQWSDSCYGDCSCTSVWCRVLRERCIGRHRMPPPRAVLTTGLPEHRLPLRTHWRMVLGYRSGMLGLRVFE